MIQAHLRFAYLSIWSLWQIDTGLAVLNTLPSPKNLELGRSFGRCRPNKESLLSFVHFNHQIIHSLFFLMFVYFCQQRPANYFVSFQFPSILANSSPLLSFLCLFLSQIDKCAEGFYFKPLSVTNNSAWLRSFAEGHLGRNSSAHVVFSWSRSHVRYKWNGPQRHRFKSTKAKRNKPF